MNRWVGRCLAVGLLSSLAVTGWAQPESATKSDKPSAEARAALKHAASLRREARGQEIEQKHAVYRRMAEAYEGILDRFAEESVVRVEARFRLAELNRLLGEIERATELYEQVTTEESAQAFGARARLEIGHLYRRAKQWRTAEEHYARVWKEHIDQTVYGARAMIWAGKCAAQDDRMDEARSQWREVTNRYGAHFAQVIQAFDALADSQLDAKDRAGAEAVIAECERWVEAVGSPDSKEREAARKSFEKMSTRKRLAKISGGDR